MEPVTSPEQEIRRELYGPEQLLWAGRPIQGFLLRPHDIFLLPWGWIWAVVIYRDFYYFHFTSNDPLYMQLRFGFWVLLGLYLFVGRFLIDIRQREVTYYGVTNQRAIIVSGLLNRNVQSIFYDTLNDIELSGAIERRGTITFCRDSSLDWWGETSLIRRTLYKPTNTIFEKILDARKVYDIIQSAQKSVHSRNARHRETLNDD